MRVLLIEDDPALGAGLRDFLTLDGYRVDWCISLSQARSLVDEPYDAWLVDWNLPDGSGVQWLSAQRRVGRKTPAFVLTARDLVADRIEGLDSGADDYLVKPFAPEELSARLRALFRRTASTEEIRQWGEVSLNLAAKQAWLRDVEVELTSREWAILEALVLRSGRVISRHDLESLVLGMDAMLSSNAIDVHIFNLRQKLGKTLIETVRGMGYRIRQNAQ
ncbi:response regulator transcription factor [Hydrogenophaga sp.]|uniref:response regulator transcription factor n=1 Tax=Hydrogenophaga sp. TaxID=1904254 RepID=UPI0035B115D4